ncbi:hypothetical protein RJ641_023400 [Dillenia turbinata]|uniref:Uncharacterized protein n=1 Tax=Dillenia turbinata TaxID=194707 RepID=A0AAN8UIP1_9MAGN
MLSAPDLLPPF